MKVIKTLSRRKSEKDYNCDVWEDELVQKNSPQLGRLDSNTIWHDF